MTRWRVTVWLKDQPTVRLVKHKRTVSLREAVDWAVTHISQVGNAWQLDIDKIGFTLEWLDGGLQGWHVRYSSESKHWQALIKNAR